MGGGGWSNTEGEGSTVGVAVNLSSHYKYKSPKQFELKHS